MCMNTVEQNAACVSDVIITTFSFFSPFFLLESNISSCSIATREKTCSSARVKLFITENCSKRKKR